MCNACASNLYIRQWCLGSVYNMPNKLELRGEKIVDIACGRSHILLLSERGEVFSVGEGSRGQLGHGELENEEEPRLVEGLAGLVVVAVVCGGWHSCALTSDGDLYSWGWNMAGQLGLYNQESRGKVSVQAIPQSVDWPDQSEVHVSKVACGARHTVTLLGYVMNDDKRKKQEKKKCVCSSFRISTIC
ncbi:RCC1 domain-containing protein 1 [Homalodisca vitripennis]|nr:RCC1 domain-containing protein 1 [Homalodisca vitripennis]